MQQEDKRLHSEPPITSSTSTIYLWFRMFRKREYRDLPLATKERWIEQVQLAIKSKHGTLEVPCTRPITEYFPIQNQR